MRELVFLLEEPSAAAMLEGLLPKIVPDDLPCRYIAFEGKQDLERQLVRRIQGYHNPDALFVVLRDQDAQPDCKVIKNRLVEMCRRAGRSSALVRIACTELESFYLGDLSAVERGLGIAGLAAHQQKQKYRSPDRVRSPKEELKKLTENLYQEVAGSRAIGPHLDPFNTRSHSFRNLVAGIRRLVTA